MEKVKEYIALFDLDKTILSENSGSLLVKESYRSGLMSFGDLLMAIYYGYLYRFNLRDTLKIISGMTRWLKGATRDEIKSLSEKVINLHLIGMIRPEMIREIEFHQQRNAEVVLLSSAIYEICSPLASYLGVDNIICTTLEEEDGVLTGLPEGSFCFDDEKRVRMNSYCSERSYNLSDAYYYGDSISDLPVLELVGNPVCVAPDRKLRAIARDRKWRIYDL